MDYQSFQISNAKSVKKKVLVIVFFCFVVAIVYWISTVSFIEITVSGQKNNDLTYSLFNQGNSRTAEIKNRSNTIKKRVVRGNYEILVKQGDLSYFVIVKTNGFFRQTGVTGRLQQEKNRSFVGDNPGSCINYINNTLVSYSCGNTYDKINIHTPATNNHPTYVIPNKNSPITGRINSIIITNEGTLALIKWPENDEHLPGYFIYKVDASLGTSNETSMPDMKNDKTYSIKPYKNGFIAYEESREHFLYYNSLRSKPNVISLNKPEAEGVTPVSFDAHNDILATLYSTNVDTKKQHSEIIIYANNKSVHYTFNKSYSDVFICDKDKLCLVGGKGMDIYDISGNKPAVLFTIRGVFRVESSQNGPIAFRKNEVLSLNLNRRDGLVEYSMGEYSFGNVQSAVGGYVLALNSSRFKKVAIYIDQKTNNKDEIDKKVSELQKLEEISSLSIYDNYVYISPNLGELVYNNSLRAFNYDPAIKKTVNSKINSEIDRLGINRNIYHIVNTSE